MHNYLYMMWWMNVNTRLHSCMYVLPKEWVPLIVIPTCIMFCFTFRILTIWRITFLTPSHMTTVRTKRRSTFRTPPQVLTFLTIRQPTSGTPTQSFAVSFKQEKNNSEKKTDQHNINKRQRDKTTLKKTSTNHKNFGRIHYTNPHTTTPDPTPAGGSGRTHAPYLNAAAPIFSNLKLLMMLIGDRCGWREMSPIRHQD